jgi:hypothetical protein
MSSFENIPSTLLDSSALKATPLSYDVIQTKNPNNTVKSIAMILPLDYTTFKTASDIFRQALIESNQANGICS